MGKCYNSTVINKDVKTVWNAIRDFQSADWGKGVIESLENKGDRDGFTLGSKRLLNGVFTETLQSMDELNRTFTYTIDDGPDAVSKDRVNNYVGKVRIFPITDSNSTFVEWTSTYDSADSKAVAELCNPIYQALLKAMKDNI